MTRTFIELIDYIDGFDTYMSYETISGPDIIDFEIGFISDVMGMTQVTIRMYIHKDDVVYTEDYILTIHPYTVLNIPYIENNQTPCVMSGLFIERMNYHSDMMGGYDFTVDLIFPNPEDFGAEYFILEYYDVIEEMYKTVYYDDESVTSLYYDSYSETYQNTTNFILELQGNTTYRLRAFNAPEVLVTNEIYVGSSSFPTSFTGWYHDESMYLTGIMTPYYGFGMQVSATVYDLDLSIELEDALKFSWYRVHPYTFEMTLIEGATTDLYQTTFEDVGYYIMARLEGDGLSASGYVQLLSFETVKVFNPARIISFDRTGFVIELSHNVDIRSLNDLIIWGDYMNSIEVLQIIPQGAPRTYRIQADLSLYNDFYIEMNQGSWILGAFSQYHHMQGLSIYFKGIVLT